MNKLGLLRAMVISLLPASHGPAAAETPSPSPTGTYAVLQNVEGTYQCGGECAMQIVNTAKFQLIQVQGKEDRVQRVSASTAGLFQI